MGKSLRFFSRGKKRSGRSDAGSGYTALFYNFRAKYWDTLHIFHVFSGHDYISVWHPFVAYSIAIDQGPATTFSQQPYQGKYCNSSRAKLCSSLLLFLQNWIICTCRGLSPARNEEPQSRQLTPPVVGWGRGSGQALICTYTPGDSLCVLFWHHVMPDYPR